MTETELHAFLAGILGQEAVIQFTSGYMSEGRYFGRYHGSAYGYLKAAISIAV